MGLVFCQKQFEKVEGNGDFAYAESYLAFESGPDGAAVNTGKIAECECCPSNVWCSSIRIQSNPILEHLWIRFPQELGSPRYMALQLLIKPGDFVRYFLPI